MALMIDRLDLNRNFDLAEWPEECAEDLLSARTPVFEITNVADLCYRMDLFDKSDAGIVLHPEKFPNVAPPFRSYWLEWRCPKELDPYLSIGRFGLWCVVTSDTDDEAWSIGVGLFVGKRDPRVIGNFVLRVTREGHVTDPGRLTISPNAVEPLLKLRSPQQVEKTQPLVEQMKAATEGMTTEQKVAHWNREIDEANQKCEELESDIVKLLHTAAEQLGEALRIGVLPPLLLAHSLLGCKNVETQDHIPDPKLQKAAIRRRGKPGVRFKTLKIRPMGGGHHEQGQHHDLGGGQVALHLVRGHFKTFTPERPLFGSRVGTYWWSANVRGNVESGTVVKDYEVQV